MKKRNIGIVVVILVVLILILAYFGIENIKENNRKYEVETVSEYKYFVVKEDDRYGVIDAKGEKIIEAIYEDVKIPNPEKGIFICYEENDDIKVFNEDKEEIFIEYDFVEPLRLKNISSDLMYEKSVLKYSKNGKYGIVDFDERKITNPIYDEIDTLQFKEGELLVKKDGKFGIINIKGRTLVKTNYDKIEADKFYEAENGYKNAGYIVSKTTDEGYRYGYVNVDGKEIVEVKYNDLFRIMQIDDDDIYLICAENGKYGLLRNNKKVIENEYQSLTYIESNDTIIALKGKKYGVFSTTGEIIVPFDYKQIDITGEYIYATSLDENVKVFDINGKETNMSKNLSIISIENTNYKIYIENQDGQTLYNIYNGQKKLTNDKYTYIQYLYDNYFIACNVNGKLGIIDDSENIKIKFNYNSIQKIENTNMIQTLDNNTNKIEIYSREIEKICELENAIVENNREYVKFYNDEEIKYISKDEKEVNNIDLFKNNDIFAKKSQGKWGFVDKNENKVVDYKYEDVTEINKYGFAGIKENGKWGVINNKGKIIVEPIYELKSKPEFIGEYYQVIYGNGEIYYTK